MFGQTFYHKTIRKYVILFGTLFNDIYLNRQDADGNQIQTLKVPITYGPKNKALTRVTSDPNLNRPYEVKAPIMAFEMTSMRYDNDRKLSTIKKHNVVKNTLNTEQQSYVYNPVPYNIDFSLYILVKNAEDGTRILEQILPFFTPDWTTTVNLIPEMEVKLDIPIIISNISVEDNYEGASESQRTIIWKIDFTLKGYLFGPVRKSGVIKLANTNFFGDITPTSTYSNITITPGLLANGSPTTDPNLTISNLEINEDDDWAYIIQKSIINEE